MKEKKKGKLIFGLLFLIVLALQAPVRETVYHFFTREDIVTQIGVKQKARKKLKQETVGFFEKIQKEVEHILDELKK
ncbi:hypothetical protein [Lactococcus taiwanensis]|uniref:hypothetical protein n=1 Tax=Lactococcus taiwanensis TaxID=1151742 RepID=UPI003511D6E6